MPYPSTPCGRATPETALQPFQGGQPAAVFYSFGHPTPMVENKYGDILYINSSLSEYLLMIFTIDKTRTSHGIDNS
jgi:hypothetical protein